MCDALGIINFSRSQIHVEGLQDYRSIGAFSFLGRYRMIDFPLSNMTNSGMDQIKVFLNKQPRSLVEHLGTGRHYNINSKRGNLHILFSEGKRKNSLYDTDIATYLDNLSYIEESPFDYVIIAPSHMIFKQDFDDLMNKHVESGADITLLYHTVDNANESFFNCDILNLNKQKGVLSIEKNRATAKNRNIFMDTYVMRKDLFIDLLKKGASHSALYTLPQVVNHACQEFDVRGISHRGYFAAVTDLKSYFDANLSLLDAKTRNLLFEEDWPIYTRTSDSCPTKYLETASARSSIISNGCTIEGDIENSIIGRGCNIKKGAVLKNCVVLPNVTIGEDVHAENLIIDKYAKLIHAKEVICKPEQPGYIKRNDCI